jgi:effector-binding domain-containing protein
VKNKKKITLLILIFLSALTAYAALFKTVFREEILIYAPVPAIHRQISALDKITKWYTPFADADTTGNKIINPDRLEYENTVLKLTNIVGYSAGYQIAENKKQETIFFDVVPDTARYSKVTLTYKTSIWNKIFKGDKIIRDAEKSLQNLKEYMADSKKMYGYEIEMTDVTDTAFLFSSRIVTLENKKNAFKNLYESLIRFAEVKNLGYNGVRIFYSLPFGKDSIQLFTSIGISNTQNAPFAGDFVLKRMPNKGRLLMSYYQGRFGNVDAALNALMLFKTDNELSSMAIPFVKLMTEGIEFDDTQIIQARALYPVY